MELGFAFGAMGSDCEIRIAGLDERALRAAAAAAIEEVQRIEARFSRYRDTSVVSRINAAAGTGVAVPVDAETDALLDLAARMHEASEGRFDATSGVLRKAWNFAGSTLPSREAVEALLPQVGWQHVHRGPGTVELTRPGMELDFGGIGKEYAADRASGVLLANGVRCGFVNLGGDIRVVGPGLDGSPWRFAIRAPSPGDATDAAPVAAVELAAGALATSGDYARCIVHAGRRYGHVLDATTGWPVDDWASVSVVAPTCTAAGAMATLALLSGEQAPALLRSHGHWFLAIDRDGRHHTV